MRRIFKRFGLSAVLSLVLMQPNRGMRTAALQLQRQVNAPIYDARQQFASTHKSLRVIFDFLLLTYRSGIRVRFADDADWLD